MRSAALSGLFFQVPRIAAAGMVTWQAVVAVFIVVHRRGSPLKPRANWVQILVCDMANKMANKPGESGARPEDVEAVEDN